MSTASNTYDTNMYSQQFNGYNNILSVSEILDVIRDVTAKSKLLMKINMKLITSSGKNYNLHSVISVCESQHSVSFTHHTHARARTYTHLSQLTVSQGSAKPFMPLPLPILCVTLSPALLERSIV